MAQMTEEEAKRLDKLYTEITLPTNPEKPGIFARQIEAFDFVTIEELLEEMATEYTGILIQD